MKITLAHPMQSYSAKYSIANKKENNNNYQKNYLQTPTNYPISFLGIKKISKKEVNDLINNLIKENIHYELIGTPNSVSVIEFRNIKRLAKKTTFFFNDKKEEIVYKYDGETPHLKYKYQKNKITALIKYGNYGEKTHKETFYENGQRASHTVYHGVASLPTFKFFYQQDGKTLKAETKFHANSRIPKIIKEFFPNGKIANETLIDESGFITSKTKYNKKGEPIMISEFSKTGNFIPLSSNL